MHEHRARTVRLRRDLKIRNPHHLDPSASLLATSLSSCSWLPALSPFVRDVSAGSGSLWTRTDQCVQLDWKWNRIIGDFLHILAMNAMSFAFHVFLIETRPPPSQGRIASQIVCHSRYGATPGVIQPSTRAGLWLVFSGHSPALVRLRHCAGCAHVAPWCMCSIEMITSDSVDSLPLR